MRGERFYRRLNAAGVIAGLVAGIVLVVNRPEPPIAPSQAIVLPAPSARPERPGPISISLGDPPLFPASMLSGRTPMAFPLVLPSSVDWRALSAPGFRIDPSMGGTILRADPTQLTWGLNLIHLSGVDRYGWPIDRADAFIVSDEIEDPWIRNALTIRLTREGFDDTDDLRDDLSSLAEERIGEVISDMGPVEVGPFEARRFRVGEVEVDLAPNAGGLTGRVTLRDSFLDVEAPAIILRNVPVHRMWVDVELTLGTDRMGHPRIRVAELEPHVDLVRSGEGAMNWVLDHGAWFLEVAAEVLGRDPMRDALTAAIDDALSHWIDEVSFRSAAPLREVPFTVRYRFAEIATDGSGLSAVVNFQVSCEGDPETVLRPLRYPVAPPGHQFPSMPHDSVVRIALSANAVNGVFHALWSCSALDSTVAFEDAARALPIAIPSQVTTHFGLPPVLQSDDEGTMLVALGRTQVEVSYPDLEYTADAAGFLPVVLAPADEGRALRVELPTNASALNLYTDCVSVAGQPCRDNPLFDRLAWLAVPFLPPIGASIPLPDVKLSDSESLRFRIDRIQWDHVGGMLFVGGGYEAD